MQTFLRPRARSAAVLITVSLLAGTANAKAEPAAVIKADRAQAEIVVGDIPASDPQELTAFKAATRKLYDMKERAFAEGKVEPIVNRFYAANAISVGPDGKPAEGRAALDKHYKDVVPVYTVKAEPIHSFVRGAAGWEWVNFYINPKDPKSAEKPFTLALLLLWAKVGDQWVAAGDSYVVGQFAKK